MAAKPLKTCWIVTEGIAGTENQCIGVAEALGVDYVIKRIKLRAPWKQFSPWLCWGHNYALAADSDPVAPPYPDLVLASGRKSIGIAAHIRRASRGQSFIVQIQDPRIDPKHFDLVVVPQHDPTRGDNVLVTKAGLHRVTQQKLVAAKEQFEKKFELAKPRVAVLIGGSSKAHTMTRENAKTLAQQLLHLAESPDIGLLITASRRTGEENAKLLREMLQGPAIYFWDGTGDNPYFAFLALADYIIVTEDSVSMTSEALSTGKPVYIAALEGGAKRLDTFHKILQEQGYTRPFTGLLEHWSYTPPDDTQRVAEEIRRRLKGKTDVRATDA
ncbi:MAG TPA: mitochondrial fission ELM1 family protein [Patescibacteria group bacterium]|nr:mitochondrial fission ELM1 family protein [Patescibacteria group bacterium]